MVEKSETLALSFTHMENTFMAPSPLLVLMDSSSEGLVPDAPPRLGAEGDEGAQQSLQYGLFGAI